MSFTTMTPANRDVAVRSDRQDANAGNASALRSKDDARILLGFDIDKPKDAHFVSAQLQLWSLGTGWVGTESISARRIGEKWSESKATWNNKPAADGASPTLGPTVMAVTAANQQFVMDVTSIVQTGPAWKGIDLRFTGSSTDGRAFRSSEHPEKLYRPRLVITWTEDPIQPVELAPSDSRVISTPNPTLTWDWVSKTEDLQQVNIQVDDAIDFATPVYDSGWVSAADPQFPLTGYTVPASSTRYWRVKVKTASGSESPWSEVAAFSYVPLPALAITAPTNPFGYATPNVTWTFTGQQRARVLLYQVTPVFKPVPIWTSQWRAAGVLTAQVPVNIITSFNTYRFVVQAWDAQARQATPGAADYAQATLNAAFNLSASVPPTTTLVATIPDPQKPMVRLTWTRTAGAPTVYGIYVDGDLKAVIDGTLLTYDLYLVRPQKPVTIQVAPGVGDPAQYGTGNPTQVVTVPCIGAWLWDPTYAPTGIQILDEGNQAYQLIDDLGFLLPTGKTFPVWQRSISGGYTGQISGVVRSLTIRDQVEALWRLGLPVRLVIGDMNVVVMMGAPSFDYEASGNYIVSIPVTQVGV